MKALGRLYSSTRSRSSASNSSGSFKGSKNKSSRSINSVGQSPASKRKPSKRSTAFLFAESKEGAPSIGGCADILLPHSDFLLTPEVVLFEPSPSEIFAGGVPAAPGKPGNRMIFLNTSLTEDELVALRELHEALRAEVEVTQAGDPNFPEYVTLHALRILQYRRNNIKRSIDLIRLHLHERVQRLPISEADVLNDLKSGFMYWHGRDRKCRPCLVIRLENMGTIKTDRERAVRLVIFVLEYAIRYCLVPGRVENWVVILDLQNALKVVSFSHISSIVRTAVAIAGTLESIYCGRMVWMKIVNMAYGLRKVVESCIPAEKAEKVSFPRDIREAMAPLFEDNQLEARYGGTAPNLAPAETYPFHFFPNCCGASAAGSATGGAAAEHPPLHNLTNRAFHEGCLWDRSTPEATAGWLARAQASCLTPQAAEELSRSEAPVKPCRDVEQWLAAICAEKSSKGGHFEAVAGRPSISVSAHEQSRQRIAAAAAKNTSTKMSL